MKSDRWASGISASIDDVNRQKFGALLTFWMQCTNSGNGREAGMQCIAARVSAIHVRRRKELASKHQARIAGLCEAWEMLVPELVFAPNH